MYDDYGVPCASPTGSTSTCTPWQIMCPPITVWQSKMWPTWPALRLPGMASAEVGDESLGQVRGGLRVLAGVQTAVHNHMRFPRLGSGGVLHTQLHQFVL